ncbi:MAG: MBL fold metallo-hydrolase [Patescibacteria group bacterium]|nr:MBL fold metallo-hydrolase [Patescibacteria group bacterium]MDE1988408.1 MBL fold metallo-hydrolase [Patescibacteria group bacterium]MDE2217860.1 MBL fold metallo-hydrolase [Patescibacteria group bacterium]
MIITYQGVESFKAQFGDTVLAFNPISKDSKFKNSRFFADVALITANHPDFNGAENLSYSGKEPFVISGPGEYEIKGVFIKGFATKSNYGGKERINTVYSVALEGMNLFFLGALGEPDVKEAKEAVDGIDVLFVPIGGNGVLEPSAAYKFAVSLEPKIIIPMHYGGDSDKNALKVFLKEAGAEETKHLDKLTLKKKDLESKEGEVVVIVASV